MPQPMATTQSAAPSTATTAAQPPQKLLGWGGAVQFLMVLHFINFIGFAGWNAMLHNYTIDKLGLRLVRGWFDPDRARDPGLPVVHGGVLVALVSRADGRLCQPDHTRGRRRAVGVDLVGDGDADRDVRHVGRLPLLRDHEQVAATAVAAQGRRASPDGQINSAGAMAQFATYATIAAAGFLGWKATSASYEGIFYFIGILCAVLTVCRVFISSANSRARTATERTDPQASATGSTTR